MNQYELAHYGVLGMKWGVRKKREQKPRNRKRGFRYTAKQFARDAAITAAVSLTLSAIGTVALNSYRRSLTQNLEANKRFEESKKVTHEALGGLGNYTMSDLEKLDF